MRIRALAMVSIKRVLHPRVIFRTASDGDGDEEDEDPEITSREAPRAQLLGFVAHVDDYGPLLPRRSQARPLRCGAEGRGHEGLGSTASPSNSATAWPLRNTTMRCARPISSSSSDEMSKTPMPDAEPSAIIWWIATLVSHVDAVGRFVGNTTARDDGRAPRVETSRMRLAAAPRPPAANRGVQSLQLI